MASMEKRDGFTLIELLIVIGVAGVLLALGGTLAGNFAKRHSTDNVTRTISSSLQLIKIKSAREGVDYLTTLTFDSSQKTLTVAIQRGNSNRGKSSCTSCYSLETSQTMRIKDPGITINPASQTLDFNPNGTVVDSNGNLITQPITVTIQPTDGGDGKRCGIVTVLPIGRISIVEGNWKSSSSTCTPVY